MIDYNEKRLQATDLKNTKAKLQFLASWLFVFSAYYLFYRWLIILFIDNHF